MRVGLLADVHANLHALETTLAAVELRGVDAWVTAGDLVGYGPEPDAVTARIAALGGTVVAGNHDLMAIGALPAEGSIPLARQSLAWTAKVMSPATRALLAGLPPRAAAPGGLLVAHGSLDDPEHYVRTPDDAHRQLRRAEALQPGCAFVVLGHTHRALVVGEHTGLLGADATGTVRLPPDERCLINPGSVGQSRERRALARAAILDTAARTVELLGLPYDERACRASLRAAGLPPGSCHLRPRPVRALAGRALRRAGLRRGVPR